MKFPVPIIASSPLRNASCLSGQSHAATFFGTQPIFCKLVKWSKAACIVESFKLALEPSSFTQPECAPPSAHPHGACVYIMPPALTVGQPRRNSPLLAKSSHIVVISAQVDGGLGSKFLL